MFVLVSLQGASGYPRPIWDKQSGIIDKQVAEYVAPNMHNNYHHFIIVIIIIVIVIVITIVES
jgi:hypothetical protein